MGRPCGWGSSPRPLGAAGLGHLSADGDSGGAAGAQRGLQRDCGAKAHRREAAGEAARGGLQSVGVRGEGICGHKKRDTPLGHRDDRQGLGDGISTAAMNRISL